MVSQTERFNQVVLDWLDGVAEAAPKEEGDGEVVVAEEQAAAGDDAAA